MCLSVEVDFSCIDSTRLSLSRKTHAVIGVVPFRRAFSRRVCVCGSAHLAVVPVAVVYVVGLVLYRGAEAVDAPPSLYVGPHPFLSIPVMVLAFQCHIQIVPIFAELGVSAPRRERKGRRNEEELGLLLLPHQQQGKACIDELAL